MPLLQRQVEKEGKAASRARQSSPGRKSRTKPFATKNIMSAVTLRTLLTLLVIEKDEHTRAARKLCHARFIMCTEQDREPGFQRNYLFHVNMGQGVAKRKVSPLVL